MRSRTELFKELEDQIESGFDFIVVGGGATGLGCALDSAARGFRTLLIEKDDFGNGTSSRSTKLIHGGVRYLAQGNLPLVYEALRERKRLFHNAPHIVTPLELLIPNYSFWEGPYYSLGLKIYDLLASHGDNLSSKWIGKSNCVDRIANLNAEELSSGILYYDGKFDDARMALVLMKTFLAQGGVALNYLEFKDFIKRSDGKIIGIECLDRIGNQSYKVQGRVVVNATGAHSEFLQLADDHRIELNIRRSQGSHIVVDRKFLGGNTALLIPDTPDGRVLFAIPWLGKVLIGTTDVPVENVKGMPIPSHDEINFILQTAARYLTKPPEESDIQSVFAGIRPLALRQSAQPQRSTKKISREHQITISNSGLVSISGGKWTTYRKMGEDLVDKAIKHFELSSSPCATQDLPLYGFTTIVEPDLPDHFRMYGSCQPELRKWILTDPSAGDKIHPDLNYLNVEIDWACKRELAVRLEDVLARRTRMLFLNARAAIESARSVVRRMSTCLKMDRAWEEEELRVFEKLAGNYLYKA